MGGGFGRLLGVAWYNFGIFHAIMEEAAAAFPSQYGKSEHKIHQNMEKAVPAFPSTHGRYSGAWRVHLKIWKAVFSRRARHSVRPL